VTPRLSRRRLVAAAAALPASSLLWSQSAMALPPAASVARRYAEGVLHLELQGPVAKKAQGFFVSSSGLLCTVMTRIKVGDRLAVSGDAFVGHADVVAADADGLALAQLTPAPATPVTALGMSPDGTRSRWLVGLMRSDKGVSAVVGGEEAVGMMVPVPQGAPILNDRDDVVAVVSRRRGGGTVDVIASARVLALAKGARG
jgi:hypothetical protein